ncbi:MAG: cytoplasmic protein [Rubrivivax sp.]|nr:MAG: cytoplasmic protein [Rubrivivax sp.]
MNELLAAFRYTTNNWAQIGASKLCGCCHCVEIFTPEDIVGWTGLTMDNLTDPAAVNQQTAMCPRCGSEAVLGDGSGFPINANFLARMNEAWFQRTMVHRPAARK